MELVSSVVDINASYVIDYDDGTPLALPTLIKSHAPIELRHVYVASGVYSVKVNVSNEVSSGMASLQVEVNSEFSFFECGLYWMEFPGGVENENRAGSDGGFVVRREIDVRFGCTFAMFKGRFEDLFHIK